jgi:hypothetical protein
MLSNNVRRDHKYQEFWSDNRLFQVNFELKSDELLLTEYVL